MSLDGRLGGLRCGRTVPLRPGALAGVSGRADTCCAANTLPSRHHYGNVEPVSKMTFQEPSGCLRQMVMY